ncbi:permease [Neomoorella thermoacetica]|uniref:Predicted permeases n=1 Tax=Moorella thermoacetica Y72 TaxID=1325331 RepID=A0A0S6UEK3_NEOTH|nr:permease [Moorella thermoacetica]OIQ10798.1 putative two-component membrane permease complex subunit [Moorella thermoacetica]OIQ58799.1 putative two-component membrane permease complex subunit [Moorella thermoacetica]GAF25419.1 predicted permeases [Moorella thermoacetica Y72]
MLKALADYIVYRLFNLAHGTRLAEALNFFIYDSVKIFIMLAVIIFIVSVIRSFFPPERTRAILSRRHEYVGNILASLLGIVTPFCSCSAVPVFIGFVESGVPLGVTFSFLISSPMVNEVALVMLWGMFGWKIALIYIASGLAVAIAGGLVIGRLHLEREVEDYVYEIKLGETATLATLTWQDRVNYARGYVKEILKRVWLFVLIGIGIGGFIHGYAPETLLLRYAGPGNLLAVPVAVAIGVPLYSNAAGTIPIVQALMEKGMSLGTVLAFMMSVTALSLPEMIILRKVLKPRLIAIFIGIITVAIMLVGYLFNIILG